MIRGSAGEEGDLFDVLADGAQGGLFLDFGRAAHAVVAVAVEFLVVGELRSTVCLYYWWMDLPRCMRRCRSIRSLLHSQTLRVMTLTWVPLCVQQSKSGQCAHRSPSDFYSR